MFSFLQQLVPKRRDDLDVDEDAYADSSAMPAFVPPAPLVKPPLTEEEIAEQEREAAEAEAREAAERAEAERLEQEALDDEKRRAEERLVERQERARLLLEERAAERQRREEAHLAAQQTNLVAVPDLAPESDEALASHVVEEHEAPTADDETASVHEAAHAVEESDEDDVLEHVGRADDAFVFVPPAPEAEHVAQVASVDHVTDDGDGFAFVPPAAQVEHQKFVDAPADAPETYAEPLAFEERVEPVALEEHDEPLALEEHGEPVAPDEHVEPDAPDEHVEPVAPDEHVEPVDLEEPDEPVALEEHARASEAYVPDVEAITPVSAPVERYTWPATLLHHEHAMQYGEAARRNLISMIVELNDAKLARVLHDALYEERPDGLRPEVLSALQRSYNGEELRETYERFERIGSDREREIARAGIRSLDEGHA